MSTFMAPKVYITTRIENVTEKDYELFAKYSPIPAEKKIKDNCRYINVKVKVVEFPILTRNIKIERTSLQEYLALSNTGIQFLGRYYSISNKGYFDGIDVYLEDISDEKLISIFEDYKIEVSWVDLWNGQNSKIFYLKDYFK